MCRKMSYIAAWILCGGAATCACGAESAVAPATHTSPIAPDANVAAAKFDQQAARVGDRISQDVRVQLELKTTIVQANQVAHEEIVETYRQQRRFIEVVEVDSGRVRRAHVSFPRSRLKSPENPNPSEEVVQPVEGNSYLVTRQGDRLLVNDTEGAIPPLDEYQLVVESVATLGLPSPLAKFLLGRTVRMGERLKLPKQLAREIMGPSSQVGNIEKFELELRELRAIDGQPCAIFAATIVASGDASNPVEMNVVGQVIMELATCRTVRAELAGPMTMSVNQQTNEGEFQYNAAGSLQVAIESQFGHAPAPK